MIPFYKNSKIKYLSLLIIFYCFSFNYCQADQTFFGLPREQLKTDSQKIIFDNAYSLFLNNKTSESIEEVKKLSAEVPDNANLYLLLANLYALKGNINAEIDSYKKSIEIDKNSKLAYLQLANFYIKCNSYNSAIAVLEDYLKVKDKDIDVLNKLANIYCLDGKNDLAELTFKKILSIDKNSLTAYKGLATVYTKQNDYQNAINYYKISLLDKKDPEILNNIGLCYTAIKIYNEAINYFSEAASLAPDNLEYLYNLASASSEANDYNKAIDTLNKIMSVDNNNTKARSLLTFVTEKIIAAQMHKPLPEEIISVSLPVNETQKNDVTKTTEETSSTPAINSTKPENTIKLKDDTSVSSTNKDAPHSEPAKQKDLPVEYLLSGKNNKIVLHNKDLVIEADAHKIDVYKTDKQIEVKFTLDQLKTLSKELSNIKKSGSVPVVSQPSEDNRTTEKSLEPLNRNLETPVEINKPFISNNNEFVITNNNSTPQIQEQSKVLEPVNKPTPDLQDINEPITLEKPRDNSPLMSENPLEALDLQNAAESENPNYDMPNNLSHKINSKINPENKEQVASASTSNTLKSKDNSELLERISVAKPNNDKVQYQLAANYCSLGEYDKALDAIKKAIEIDRGNRQYLILLADIYIKSNDFKKAKSVLYNLLKDPVESDEVYRQLGYVHYKLNELDEAQNAYRKAIKINPNNVISRLLLALAYEKSENYTEETAEFNKILELDPNNKTALKGLAGSFYSQQKYPEAILFYERLINAFPKEKENYLYLENIYMKQLSYDKAQQIMHKLILEVPHEAEGYYYLANLYARSGKIDLAIENYRKTVQIEPKNPLYHYFLGTAYVQKGLMKNAKDEVDLLKMLDINYATQLEKLTN